MLTIVSTPFRRYPAARRLLLAGLALGGAGIIACSIPATRAQPAAIGVVTPTSLPGVGQIELADADQAMAQRFATAAYDVLQAGDNDRNPMAWQQASAFLEAAARLDPTEPMYPRLRAMAKEQIGDGEGAAKALDEYLALNKTDDVARLKLIEYYASQQQSNDKRIAYLTSLVQKPAGTLSNEVKSRCATWAAAALLERSRTEAVAMVAQAVQLDPLNLYAQRMQYELVTADGTPVERLRSLLAQLRCNPAQINILASTGKELADAGLVREAGRWYTSAYSLANRLGVPLDSRMLTDFTAQLYLNGELKLANDLTGYIVEHDRGNIDGWFLKLTLQKNFANQADYQRDLELAKRVLVGRAALIANAILEQEADELAKAQPATAPAVPATGPASQPTSRPFDFATAFSARGASSSGTANDPSATPAATGDTLAKVVRRLKDPNVPSILRLNFIEAMTDLAWYEIYYSRSEISGEVWVNIVKQLLGDAAVPSRRLAGWLDVLRRRDAQAMQTLWSIRESDALSGMGVVELLSRGNWVPATQPGAVPATRPTQYDPDLLAQKLVNNNPNGLIGAILVNGFKAQKVYPQPGTNAEAMRDELRKFPLDFIAVIDQPDKFYIPIGESIRKYRLGEPIMVQIRIQNNSNYDLTVGPDGIIKPDLWFDGRVALKTDRLFPMCGNDKISGPLVLKARTAITQLVRVDQGKLAAAMRERPAGLVNLTMTVMTNPMFTRDETSETGFRVVAGSAGVRRQFKDSIIRSGLPIATETNRKRLDDLASGLPSEKFLALDVMAAYVDQARGEDAGWQTRGDKNKPASVALEPEFVEKINRAQTDRINLVGAWAAIVTLRLQQNAGDEQAKLSLVQNLAASPIWEVRLAAVCAAKELDTSGALTVAKTLSSDVNPIVRLAAESELSLAESRAKRKTASPAGPATAPAAPVMPTGPSSPAGAQLPKSK